MYILLILITLLFPLSSHASELTAAQLNSYCEETAKGFMGGKFDATKSEMCRGYLMGFFDSMIIADTISGKPHFCIPPALPKSQNTLILDAWVAENKKIADSTTAAVALFSAYTKKFPCK